MIQKYRWQFLIVGAFFLLGLSWGWWSNHTSADETTPPLVVLCPKTWLPTAMAEEIAQKLHVRVTQLDFDSWSEFVRLAANTQGHADVICFHSFLAKDLVQSRFLDRSGLGTLRRFHEISVDFMKMPFDPNYDYTAPLFWGVNGFLVRSDIHPTTWQAAWPKQGAKMTLLYPDLELLWRMRISGMAAREDEEDDNSKHLENFVQTFFKSVGDLQSNQLELSDEEMKKYDFIQMSSGPAAVFLRDHKDWTYWLPADGVSFWMALVAIGSQSQQKSVARSFIDELLRVENAQALHKLLGHGVVDEALDSADGVLPMQKSRFLHEVPLDRIRFPDLTIEILPRWERIVSEE